MGKQSNIPVFRDSQSCADRSCAAGLNLWRVLSVRTAMAPDRPIRDAFTDRGGGDPFVVAVVPLDDVVADLHLIAEPCQLAGASCPLQGRAEFRCEVLLAQNRDEGAGFGFTLGQQWQVCPAGVLSIKTLFRRSVAEQPELA